MSTAKEGFARYDANLAQSANPVMSSVSTEQGPICLLRDATGAPAGVFPCEENPVLVDSFSTRGFKVEHVTFPNSMTNRGILVTARSRAVEQQFTHLMQDLFDHVADSVEPSKQIRDRLSSWRELFGGRPGEPMSPSAQLGLLAELHLLERAIDSMGQAAIGAWHVQGQATSRLDFLSATGAVEVKATTGAESLNVTIHGFNQLAIDDRPLGLLVERFEADPAGDSIVLALGRIRDKSGIDVAALEDPLEALGYSDQHSEAYAVFRWRSVQVKYLEVDDDFPRITPSSIVPPSAADFISHVQYGVNVGPLPGVEADEAWVAAIGVLS